MYLSYSALRKYSPLLASLAYAYHFEDVKYSFIVEQVRNKTQKKQKTSLCITIHPPKSILCRATFCSKWILLRGGTVHSPVLTDLLFTLLCEGPSSHFSQMKSKTPWGLCPCIIRTGRSSWLLVGLFRLPLIPVLSIIVCTFRNNILKVLINSLNQSRLFEDVKPADGPGVS